MLRRERTARSFVDTAAFPGTVYRYTVTLILATGEELATAIESIPGFAGEENIPARGPSRP